MKITALDLVNKFYDEVCKEKYPNLTRRQIIDVCYSPFRYMRIAMARDYLPTIMFKNLGKFEPRITQILWFLRTMDARYLNKGITRTRYEYLKELTIRYLKGQIKKLEDDFINNKERGLIYKLNKKRYDIKHAYLTKHLIYEKLIPAFDDDFKTNQEKFNLLPNRQSSLQAMVQEIEMANSEIYSRTDFNED